MVDRLRICQEKMLTLGKKNIDIYIDCASSALSRVEKVT